LIALVADAGELVFAGGVGTADLQDPRPLTTSDRFRIASATKMFTATVVLRLAAARQLSLGDRAVSWLPTPVLSLLPPDWPATVWQLLAMRSGLPDYVPAVVGEPPSLAGLHRDYLPGELVSIAVARPGAAQPGETWRYSNTDYILLGLIIEQVTGQTLADQFHNQIFAPLGLTATSLPGYEHGIDGPHGRGYVRFTKAEGYVECTEFSPTESWAAGALISVPAELARFLEALLSGKLLAPPQLAQMRKVQAASQSGREFGLGLCRVRLPDGTPLYGMGGTHPGANCLAFRSDAGRTVVMYQNCWDRVTGGLSTSNPFLIQAFASDGKSACD
jgi:D-alanyl-D-alanine carboxypeptidase